MKPINAKSLFNPIQRSFTRHWLWWVVNCVSLVLALRLGWMLYQSPRLPGPMLFVDGLQLDIIAFSGKTGFVMLVLSLACTPLARIVQVKQATSVRKSFGLWGAFFGVIHSLYFLGGNEVLYSTTEWREVAARAWQFLVQGVTTKVPYSQLGMIALVLLVPLVLTSSRWAMRALGKNWTRIHKLVYLIAPLLAWHFWWQSNQQDKFFNWEKVLFAAVIALLLMVRIPAIRRFLTGQEARLPTRQPMRQ